MRSQSPTTMSGSCHMTESLETLSASEHNRRAMTSDRIQQRGRVLPETRNGNGGDYEIETTIEMPEGVTSQFGFAGLAAFR
jgi:hypothetical protein